MTKMANFRYFQDLPPELKAMIFWYIFDQDPIDITVRLQGYGAGKLQLFGIGKKILLHGFPSAIANMHGLLQAGPDTRAFATGYIGQQKYTCNSEALADLPLAFGPGHCGRVLDLSMDMTWSNKNFHDDLWPPLIKMFAKDLANLMKLEIRSSYEVFKALLPYPERESGDPGGTISRQDQEQRAVIRLGCFIVSRHESLKRVIKPANGGPTFDVGETRIVNRVIIDSGYTESEGGDVGEPKVVVKWKDATRQERVTVEVSAEIFLT